MEQLLPYIERLEIELAKERENNCLLKNQLHSIHSNMIQNMELIDSKIKQHSNDFTKLFITYTKCIESSKEDEDEDAIEVIEISTKNNNSYALDPKTFEVYDINTLNEEDGTTLIGSLIEIGKIYSVITYENKNYIIAKEMSDDDHEMYLCVESDQVFDKKSKKYLGILKRDKKYLYIKYI